MINSAIISVSDKSHLDILIKGLLDINPEIKIFSSGGTAEKIKDFGYNVTNISSYTEFPEAPGGLVKTLHPKVHGGILLDENKISEKRYLNKNNIKLFNLVVCNLYPFEKTVDKKASKEEIIENIDIGGPTLIRSAAKGALRHGKVAPIIKPSDYSKIVAKIKDNNGSLKRKTLNLLAYKAFKHTRDYDQKITKWTEENL